MNTSYADNITGIQDMALNVNNATGGWFFGLILLALWLVLFVTMLNRGVTVIDVLLSSSFIIGLIAGVMFGLGFISGWVLSFPAIGLLAGIMMKVWR